MKRIITILILLVSTHTMSSCQRTLKVGSTSMEPTLPAGSSVSIKLTKLPAVYEIGFYQQFFQRSDDVMYAVSRLAGGPGDTIELKDCLLWLNGKFIDNRKNIRVERKPRPKTIDSVLEEFQPVVLIQRGAKIPSSSIRRFKRFDAGEINGDINRVLGDTKQNGWTPDNFGPIVVPKAGQTIIMTRENYRTYAQMLFDFEGVAEIDLASLPKSFTIKKNYYFFLGDNRQNSMDSRFFGFVSEENILGVVE